MRKLLVLVVLAVGCGGAEGGGEEEEFFPLPAERCFVHVVDPRARPVEEVETCIPRDWIPSAFCWDVPGACDPKISDGKERPDRQASWCISLDDPDGRWTMYPSCGPKADCRASRLENPPCCGENLGTSYPAFKRSTWNCDGSTP